MAKLGKRKRVGRAKTRTRKGTSKRSKKSFKKLWKRSRRTRKRYGSKAINVKEDKEGYSKTYLKQKVTKQQQKIINKRFKNGYSPFSKVLDAQFQDTIYNNLNMCKWVWRSYLTLDNIAMMWKYFPNRGAVTGSSTITNSDVYFNSTDQSLYINTVSYRYDIVNPTDYDMNLVIYDIVAKTDTLNPEYNYYYNSTECLDSGDSSKYVGNSSRDDPVRMLYRGLSKTTGYLDGTAATPASDPTAKNIWDITLNPTESYPFNIYYKIVKKHTFRLQPGATLTHKFIHKPKALINRGWFAYKYTGYLSQTTNTAQSIALKDLSSGCLFKYWGQVTGKGDSSITKTSNTITGQDHNAVVSLSGRIMFKEYITVKWDCMDQKFNYVFRSSNAPDTADYAEENFEVTNDSGIKRVNAQDLEPNNTTNNGANNSTTNP